MTVTRFIVITILAIVFGVTLVSTDIHFDDWQWWAIFISYLIYGEIRSHDQ